MIFFLIIFIACDFLHLTDFTKYFIRKFVVVKKVLVPILRVFKWNLEDFIFIARLNEHRLKDKFFITKILFSICSSIPIPLKTAIPATRTTTTTMTTLRPLKRLDPKSRTRNPSNLQSWVRTLPFRPKPAGAARNDLVPSSTKLSTRFKWTGKTCSWKTFWNVVHDRGSLPATRRNCLPALRPRRRWTSTVSCCGRSTSRRRAPGSRLWGRTGTRQRLSGWQWPSSGPWNTIRWTFNEFRHTYF